MVSKARLLISFRHTKYPHYDNYRAINVNKTQDIPCEPEFGISRCPKINHVFRHAASSIHMSAWLPVCRKKFNRFLIR